MQHEITKRQPLLDETGRLTEAGYATSLVMDYDRNAIKGGKTRIKEWDYYLVTDGKAGVALTIADNSYMGLASISFLDFEGGRETTKSPMKLFPMGKTGFPASSEAGDVEISGKGYQIKFQNDGKKRVLSFRMEKFLAGFPITGEIELAMPRKGAGERGPEALPESRAEDTGLDVLEAPKGGEPNEKADSMVIATPFPAKKTAFYYNQKINCMPASGFVEIYGRKHIFSPESAFGCLDWGRGVWTYKNTWYWGSASGLYGGVPFGFNIGYGFGDTSAASENMLFYDGKAHKLSQVRFHIPRDVRGHEVYMEPWKFTSSDDRFEMDFVPVLDRYANTDFKVLCSVQYQVFGRFSGKAVLDDGRVLAVKNFFGFAEKVFNKW